MDSAYETYKEKLPKLVAVPPILIEAGTNSTICSLMIYMGFYLVDLRISPSRIGLSYPTQYWLGWFLCIFSYLLSIASNIPLLCKLMDQTQSVVLRGAIFLVGFVMVEALPTFLLAGAYFSP